MAAHIHTPSNSAQAEDITQLLQAWRQGESEAGERVIVHLYSDLRRLANSYIRHERGDPTLQATALVHEAFMRLHGQRRFIWRDRGHFLALAATMMRRIMVDAGRRRAMKRRHGLSPAPPLAEDYTRASRADALTPLDRSVIDELALDQALDRLRRHDPQLAQVVELRFFLGLELSDIAALTDVTARTVKRRWQTARLWLYHALRRTDAAS